MWAEDAGDGSDYHRTDRERDQEHRLDPDQATSNLRGSRKQDDVRLHHGEHRGRDTEAEEQENRHLKANNTALYLEPNIKNNPGGMRDFQTIVWVASKHFNVSDVRSLKSLGFLKPDEYSELIGR